MGKENENRDQDGAIDHAVHRSPDGEGMDAPFAKDAGHAEFSIFDGTGNESVVVTTTNKDGQIRQGTGKTSEEALDSIEGLDQQLGKGFGPGKSEGGH
ncbi:MAG TPA: hypothetical protein VF711_14200 [Acidimicrobiales bacterium]